MRLIPQQTQGLVNAITAFLHDKKATLYLYGSRIHDHLKGGDIDLLLMTEDEMLAEQLNQQKHTILETMKEQIGDQKIDFKITTPAECEQDPFLKMLLPNAVVLYQWN
jgi:predicted nucleotidyltransferase